MNKNDLIEYIDDLIGKGLVMKRKTMASSIVLQAIAIVLSFVLFILIWQQIVNGVGVSVAVISDLAGTAIITLVWVSARAAWRGSMAYAARTGQLEDLRMIVLMSGDGVSIPPEEAGKLIMSLRRDQVANDMQLGAIVTQKNSTNVGKKA